MDQKLIPAPTETDTTKTELTNDDRDWMARRLTRDEFGQLVVGAQDQTVKRTWHYTPMALHIAHGHPSYYPVFEFLRRSARQRETWQVPAPVQRRTEWIWGLPEPFRLAICEELGEDPREWLTAHDLELLQQAATEVSS